jgi:hypothetical protein
MKYEIKPAKPAKSTAVQRLMLFPAIVGTAAAIYFGFVQTGINRRLSKLAEDRAVAEDKPFVLRSGFLDWAAIASFTYLPTPTGGSEIKGEPLRFDVYRNLARGIRGFVVVGHKRHKLLFRLSSSPSLVEEIGWVAPASSFTPGFLLAVPEEKAEPSPEPNQISVSYRDIADRLYKMSEDADHRTKITGPFD